MLKEMKKLEPYDKNITHEDNISISTLEKLKDLIVRVDKLQFPMYCVVMKCGMYDDELFILERSFIITSNANMDM